MIVGVENQEDSSGKADTYNDEGVCPMPDIAQLIGGKWKLIVLQILIFKGTKRFGEIRRLTGKVTQTMLTSQLRALERDGLVGRKVYAEVPPRVEYTATTRAMKLEPVFLALHDWWVADLESEQGSE